MVTVVNFKYCILRKEPEFKLRNIWTFYWKLELTTGPSLEWTIPTLVWNKLSALLKILSSSLVLFNSPPGYFKVKSVQETTGTKEKRLAAFGWSIEIATSTKDLEDFYSTLE
jgi:hypothetical protein